MSTTQQTAERTALQGLLLLLVEVQNEARQSFAAMQHVRDLVESKHAGEMIQLARAALDAPADSRKVFHAIVSQQDLYIDRANSTDDVPRGPIMMETYLNEHHADRAWVENKAKEFHRYGWVRVAEVRVDIPSSPAPAAIPAAAASTHE